MSRCTRHAESVPNCKLIASLITRVSRFTCHAVASFIIADCMLMASLIIDADGLPHSTPCTQASRYVSSSQRPHATLPRRTLRGLRSPRSRTREICSPTPTMTIHTGRASTARGPGSRRRCGAPRRRSTRPTGSSCSRMQVLTTAWSVGSLLSRGWSAMTSTCMPRSRRSRNAAGLWRYYSTTTRSRAHLAPRCEHSQPCDHGHISHPSGGRSISLRGVHADYPPDCMQIAPLIACGVPPLIAWLARRWWRTMRRHCVTSFPRQASGLQPRPQCCW